MEKAQNHLNYKVSNRRHQKLMPVIASIPTQCTEKNAAAMEQCGALWVV